MKKIFKSNKMKFEAKGVEIKAGKNLLGRPYASATVSEGTLAAGLMVGGGILLGKGAMWTGRKIGQAIGAGKKKVASCINKAAAPATEAEEDFMEQ